MGRAARYLFVFAAGQAFEAYMIVRRHDRFERTVEAMIGGARRALREVRDRAA